MLSDYYVGTFPEYMESSDKFGGMLAEFNQLMRQIHFDWNPRYDNDHQEIEELIKAHQEKLAEIKIPAPKT